MASSNENKQGFRAKWDALSAKQKQKYMSSAVVGAVLLFAFILIGGGGESSGSRSAREKIANELLPKDSARELGMTGVAKDVDNIRVEMQKKDEQISKLQGVIQQMSRQNGKGTASDPAIQNELKDIRSQVEALKNGAAANAANSSGVPHASLEGPAHAPIARGNGPTGPMGPMGPIVPGANASAVGNKAVQPPPAFGAIRTINSDGDSSGSLQPASARFPAKASALDEDKVPTMYLPSGSILTGVIITGLDAPTGKNAMKDPIPTLIRIKHDAILPNEYRSDVKECFLLAAGHGDLASERAYLRAESVSCIRNDKKVIDVKVEMYAVGPDGKAGVRGRLVSKQGQLIAKASLAGVAQGFSTAFQGSRYQLNPTQPDYGLAAQGGAIGGVGTAFDRIAKYYLELADQIFPVIEIDAGQKISFVMVKGASMGTLH